MEKIKTLSPFCRGVPYVNKLELRLFLAVYQLLSFRENLNMRKRKRGKREKKKEERGERVKYMHRAKIKAKKLNRMYKLAYRGSD